MKTLLITYQEYSDYQSGIVSEGIKSYIESIENQLKSVIDISKIEYNFYLASQVSRTATMNIYFQLKIDTDSRELRRAFDSLEEHFIEVRIATM
jgi:hypothetical protein